MSTESIRLFRTTEHPCGYYGERRSQNIVLDPEAPELGQFYPGALAQGFRRAGAVIYRPNCAQCQACVPCRIPVASFRPNRSQRRALARNQDVVVSLRPALVDGVAHNLNQHIDLYQRYLAARHAGGGMDDPTSEDFERFLLCPWSSTHFMEVRLGGVLIANAVTDLSRTAASAVYTYYDPAYPDRSLGTFAVLQQLAHCQALGLDHLYLGYWINGHQKMDYKRQFQPAEHYVGGKWVGAETPIAR